MDSATVSSSPEAEHTLCTDAIKALKQDPAVLEAQIRTETSTQSASSEPENPASLETQKPAEYVCKGKAESRRFEEMMRLQKAALLSLAPEHFELLLSYAGVLRMQRHLGEKPKECAFCKKNGRPSACYGTHVLKDARGRVRCPVLRGYRCPACGATGDRAHTIKYCPQNRHSDRWGR